MSNTRETRLRLPARLDKFLQGKESMKIASTNRIIAIAIAILCLALATPSMTRVVSAATSDPSIGPGPPLYFSSVGGYPKLTTFGGQPALQLMPPQSQSFGGAAWNALKYSGQPVGVSLIGGYSQAGGIGLADGFTIIMFARNGTFNGQQINYGNSTIPLFGACSGICGNIVLPHSVSQYIALQWDPFYGDGSEFNLWVINPVSSVAANPEHFGCGIGVPSAGDKIAFNATYMPNGNTLKTGVADLTSGTNCSSTVGLTQYGFTNPSPSTYWVMVEGDSGSGTADWTILQVRVIGQAQVKVSEFFTDSTLNQLPLDKNGNPKVDVVLAGGEVSSTNPGQVLAWVNVTNTAGTPLQSLKVNETQPVDWTVDPPWRPAVGAIHVFFANTTSLATNPDITQPSTVTVSKSNPQTVILSIPSLNATAIGHPLMPGQSILLSVKLTYGLIRTSQSAGSYPRNYTDTASAAAWSMPSYKGTEVSGTASAFFVADAKVVG